MITSINEWKKQQGKPVNENMPGINPDLKPMIDINPNEMSANVDKMNNIIKVAEYAKGLEMSKEETKNLISQVFIDPAQAPEDISVAFVQHNLEFILSYIDSMPDDEFAASTYKYTSDMEGNGLPFECAMFIPDNMKISQLTESLNKQIKKSDFKAVYENGIFFINSLDKLNDANQAVVLNILKECNAKNITETLKWKRKIS